jgi:hypothetical protein
MVGKLALKADTRLDFNTVQVTLVLPDENTMTIS